MSTAQGNQSQLIFSVLVPATLFAELVGAIWVINRRERQPIKARQPKLILAQIFVNMILTSTLGAQALFGENAPCALILVNDYLFPLLLGGIYAVRTLFVYLKFEIMQQRVILYEKIKKEKSSRQSVFDKVSPKTLRHLPASAVDTQEVAEAIAGRSNSRRHTAWGTLWILRNREKINPFTAALLFLAIVLVGSALIFVELPSMIGVSGNLDSLQSLCPFKIHQIGVLVVQLTLLLIFFVLAFRLRQPHFADNFGIKRELKVTATLTVVSVGAYIATTSFAQITYIEKIVQMYILIVITTVMSCYEPIYASYFHAPKEFRENDTLPIQNSAAGPMKTPHLELENLLRHPVGLRKFAEFAHKHFCSENVMFWVEVENYREEATDLLKKTGSGCFALVLDDAIRMYAVFLRTSSPMCVNLPHKLVKQVRNALKITQDNSQGGDGSVHSSGNVENSVRLSNIPSHAHGAAAVPGQLQPQTTDSINRSSVFQTTGAAENPAMVLSFNVDKKKKREFNFVLKNATPRTRSATTDGVGASSMEGVTVDIKEEDLDKATEQQVKDLIAVFDECKTEIVDLMSRDLYRYFRASPDFADVVDIMKMRFEALQDAQLI